MSDLTAIKQDLDRLGTFNGSSADARTALQTSMVALFPGATSAVADLRTQPLVGVAVNSVLAAGAFNATPLGEMLVPARDDGLAKALCTMSAPAILECERRAAGPLLQLLGLPLSVLALPLYGEDDERRWLLLGHPQAQRFNGIDLQAIWLRAALSASLLDERVAQRRLRRTADRAAGGLEDLAEVQTLLQPFSPIIRGLDYAFHWQPAAGAAGDYYDLMPLSWMAGPQYLPEHGDWWGVMIGDVSGHGPAAAMEAVQFDAILRTYKGDEPPGGPAGALTYANRYFFSRRQRRCFLTSFAALFRAEHKELDYVCAGHPSALLKRGNQVTLLGEGEDGEIPLGIVRDHSWRNRRIGFGSGDMLVLYTDGIIEAKNAQGEQFGSERLKRYVESGPLDANAMLSRLRLKLIAFQGGEVGVDDQTIVVLHQRGV